ncbi:hypothetical protein V1286_007470 [Bradyrhizobium algeriense]|uniref:Uncharacterized protein n=1 Tax=Bradyrhizobium algeriense TaxID=634784 RepID=A0ABU8BPC2_9BRAD
MSTMSAQNPVSLPAPGAFSSEVEPVRVKKTRQIKNPEPRSDSIGTKKAPGSGENIVQPLFVHEYRCMAAPAEGRDTPIASLNRETKAAGAAMIRHA